MYDVKWQTKRLEATYNMIICWACQQKKGRKSIPLRIILTIQKISGRIFEIEVNKRKRGTGQRLIKVLDRLIEQGLVESYSIEAREWHNIGRIDYYYDVILRLN